MVENLTHENENAISQKLAMDGALLRKAPQAPRPSQDAVKSESVSQSTKDK